MVTKYTDGRVVLDYKENLFGNLDSLLAVGDGRVDSGSQIVPFISGTYPLFDFGALPGFFSIAPQVGYEWSEAFIDPRMMQIWDEYGRAGGFVVLGANAATPNDGVWGSKPVRTLDDFKGLKIRASGVTQTATLIAYGASAITMPLSDLAPGLITGTIDATTTSIQFGAEIGLLELVDYISIWPLTPAFPTLVAVNAEVFDSLPADLQEGLLQAGAEFTRRMAVIPESAPIAYESWVRSTDVEVIIPDESEIKKAMALMGPVIEEWLGYVGPYGPDVLRIASDYARGLGRDAVLEAIK